MTDIATVQWSEKYNGLVKIRDFKIRAAKLMKLDGAVEAEFVLRAEDEFHSAIADEMKRRNGLPG